MTPARLARGAGLLGGWVLFGVIAPRHAAGWAHGLWPLALWLALLGAARVAPAWMLCAAPSPRRADWPRRAARWSMLPMMATLAAMAEWCSAAGGLSPEAWLGLHLLLMALALCAVHAWPVLAGRAGLVLAMAASAVVALAVPGWQGWMAASCVQAVAWAGAVHAPHRAMPTSASREAAPERALAWLPAAAVLGLGLALDAFGPDALGAVQLALAGLAVAGGAAEGWRAHRAPGWLSPRRPSTSGP